MNFYDGTEERSQVSTVRDSAARMAHVIQAEPPAAISPENSLEIPVVSMDRWCFAARSKIVDFG